MGRRPTLPVRRTVLGANVRALRDARGWSQTELATRAGLSRSTVAALELGKYGSSDSDTVARLAEAFAVQKGDLEAVDLSKAPAADIVGEFESSPWFGAMKPTEDELAWLRRLPSVVWHGSRPTPESVAEIIKWKRAMPKENQ